MRLTAKCRTFTSLPAGLQALIGLSFVVALGNYVVTPFIGVLMVTPFIGVLRVEAIGLDIRVAGTRVAMATFIRFGGSILGGVVVDRGGCGRGPDRSRPLAADAEAVPKVLTVVGQAP